MEPQFDFSKAGDKIFIEGFHARILNWHLHIVFTSGGTEHAFTLPLELAKKLSRGLAQQVEEIEKKNNITIDGRLPNEPMVSPLQVKPQDENN